MNLSLNLFHLVDINCRGGDFPGTNPQQLNVYWSSPSNSLNINNLFLRAINTGTNVLSNDPNNPLAAGATSGTVTGLQLGVLYDVMLTYTDGGAEQPLTSTQCYTRKFLW